MSAISARHCVRRCQLIAGADAVFVVAVVVVVGAAQDRGELVFYWDFVGTWCDGCCWNLDDGQIAE